MDSIPPKPFYFIRHGQTDWNRGNLNSGTRDVPLNAHGIAQAHRAANQLRLEPIAQIISSPLQRALKTADIIAAALKQTVEVVEAFREYGVDPLTGTSSTATEFEARVLQGLQNTLSLKGPVLIVAHADVYSAIQRLLGVPVRGIQNCEVMLHQPADEGEGWMVQILK